MPTSDRIVIKDLLLRGIIGLNDRERDKPQDIVVNITMETDVRAAGASDDPAGILNYRSVTKDVIAHVEAAEPLLVETLATGIARICVVDHGAARATVCVEKPGALRFARSVGVEITRDRSDFDA
jgi:dihydroneopterin aldolase/D-erythro-7,8-dihydroneopterin triphosphate epimerase